jgi:pimeloyl-ACP methyl ester carboxylesterase
MRFLAIICAHRANDREKCVGGAGGLPPAAPEGRDIGDFLRRGSRAMTGSFVLVTGPPASAAMWADVRRRIEARGHRSRAVDLFDPVPADPFPDGLARRLAANLDSHDVLVVHGTAVPVGMRVASAGGLAGLVVTNGPVHALDPVLRLASALCRLGGDALRPCFVLPLLWSHAGLRRAVVAICGPLLRTADHRRAVARFLASLPRAVEHPPVVTVPSLLAWGDDDVLYGPSHADRARRWLPRLRERVIPGGRHYHPVERPWALADIVVDWLGGQEFDG